MTFLVVEEARAPMPHSWPRHCSLLQTLSRKPLRYIQPKPLQCLSRL